MTEYKVYRPSEPLDDDEMELIWDPENQRWEQFYWSPLGAKATIPMEGPLTGRAIEAILEDFGTLNPEKSRKNR